MDRREFLKLSAKGVFTFLWLNPALFSEPFEKGEWEKVLLLVELRGGNDGLNTLVPYKNPLYRKLRPKLAISSKEVFPLTGDLGLHRALSLLFPLWQNQEMAILQGVGYPSPNRSHFRSIAIWETASSSQEFLQTGWIARLFQITPPPRDLAADGILLDRGSEGPLKGGKMRNLFLSRPKLFFEQASRIQVAKETRGNPVLAHLLKVERHLVEGAKKLKQLLARSPSPGKFPPTSLGKQLSLAAQLLMKETPAPVLKVSLGGFDTHSGQKGRHPALLREFATALRAFRDAMKKAGRWNHILVMTYSEFGRRVYENGSEGTDHGTAAPHFFLGGAVQGGLYGSPPNLEDLEQGDLKYTIDFRSMYRTVAEKWWKIPAPFLQSFPVIDVIR